MSVKAVWLVVQYPSVTLAGQSAQTLAYDTRGNLTGDGTWTYTYDAENRMLSAVKTGTNATFVHDPLGRRVKKQVGTARNWYLSDGADEIAEYTGITAATLAFRYIPGPAIDQPVAMVTAAGAKTYFHTDKRGSVIAMTDSSGNLAEGTYTYDSFGNVSASTGVPFKFTGRRLDAETGLYYYRARYYSSALGRFLQTDPVGYGPDMNQYAYTYNDPVNRNDPSGLCSETGSHIKGGPTGRQCPGETEGLSNASVNRNTAKKHPKEYAAMTQAYRENFGKEFNPYNTAAHVNEAFNDTCLKSDCSRSSVFEGLTHCPTPMGCSGTAFKSGDITFAGPGDVKVEVDAKNFWIMNITIPKRHLLYPGVVLREATEHGKYVGVLSISIGMGMWPKTNYDLTDPVWGIANAHLQQRMFYCSIGAC